MKSQRFRKTGRVLQLAEMLSKQQIEFDLLNKLFNKLNIEDYYNHAQAMTIHQKSAIEYRPNPISNFYPYPLLSRAFLPLSAEFQEVMVEISCYEMGGQDPQPP